MGYPECRNLAEFEERQKDALDIYLEALPNYWTCRPFDGYLTELFHADKEAKEAFRSRLKASRHILDLGCGHGCALPGIIQISPPGATIVGVDIDRDALENAKRLAEDEAPDCDVMLLDDEKGIPDRMLDGRKTQGAKRLILYQTNAEGMVRCKEDTFDLILSVQAFKYFSDKMTALSNLLRILKEGGTAYLGTAADDVLLFDEGPGLQALQEVQETLNWHEYSNPGEAAAEMFKNRGGTPKILDMHVLASACFKGIEVKRRHPLTIAKKGKVSARRNLRHLSFLIGTVETNFNYTTLSVYVKDKKQG